MNPPQRLNLGCCDRRFPGFVNVDRIPPADFVADLEAPWPWQDSTVAEIRAYDVIEHIGDCDHVIPEFCCERCGPRRQKPNGDSLPYRAHDGRIHVMNEAWRILKRDGLFDIEVPTTDGMGAWQDPTHRTFWNRNSFLYYTAGDPHRERFDGLYGVKARFNVVGENLIRLPGVVKLKIQLRAVK